MQRNALNLLRRGECSYLVGQRQHQSLSLFGLSGQKSRSQHTQRRASRPPTRILASTDQPNYSSPQTAVAESSPVHRFIESINKRNLESALLLLSEDVQYCNYAVDMRLSGKQQVSDFLETIITQASTSAIINIDKCTNEFGANVAIVWHIQVDSSPLDLGRGMSFYDVSPSGEILNITDAPEHVIKYSPAALPAVQSGVAALKAAAPFLYATRPLNDAAGRALSAAAGFGRRVLGDDGTQGILAGASSTNTITQQQSTITQQSSTTSSIRQSTARTPARARVPQATSQTTSLTGVTSTTVERQPASAPDTTESDMVVSHPGGWGGDTDSTWGDADSTWAGDSNSVDSLVAPATPDLRLINGIWTKDQARCDNEGFESCLKLLSINGVQRVTARTLNDIEMVYDEGIGKLAVRFITPIPHFKVTENYRVDGTATFGRRDLRRGQTTAITTQLPDGFSVQCAWGEPKPAKQVEVYRLVGNNELHVASEVVVGGKVARAGFVYTRTG